MNNYIVAAGVKQDIGCPVIKWNDPGGYNFYKTGKLTVRKSNYEQLQNEISVFVLHHSASFRSAQTFGGLVSRGLSVQFMIDDDNVNGFATIHQCADIKDYCYSHAPLNAAGPGVEVASMVTAWSNPSLYSESNQKKYGVTPHETTDATFHGLTKKVFAITDAQMNSLAHLLAGFCKMFPLVRPDFPRNDDGSIITTTTDKLHGYILDHLMLNREKFDLAGYDHEKLIKNIAEIMINLPEPEVEKSIYQKLIEKAKQIFQ